MSRATWNFLEHGNCRSCAGGAGSPVPDAGNAGGFPSGEVLVGKSLPGMVPGGDLEVPVLLWPLMGFGEIERVSILCAKIVFVLFIMLELPKNTE